MGREAARNLSNMLSRASKLIDLEKNFELLGFVLKWSKCDTFYINGALSSAQSWPALYPVIYNRHEHKGQENASKPQW